MKNLLLKEFTLAIHPTVLIFLALDTMLLIPNYPYYVAFIYTCLSLFFIFITGRENKDVFYTVLLPIRKKDAVKARCLMIAIIELVQIIVAVPFAYIRNRFYPIPNQVGIEPNFAFFGFVLIMFAIFNMIFIPWFYKTAYKVGAPLLVGGIVIFIYIAVVEVAVQIIPVLKHNLDTVAPEHFIVQLPILLAGILIFAVSMLVCYKKAAASFEKVNV